MKLSKKSQVTAWDFFIGAVFYENDFCGSGFYDNGFYKSVLGSYLMSMVDAYLCNNLTAFGGSLSDNLAVIVNVLS